MPTKDDPARTRALTALDETFLVEASAGTGKTSLLAGRVAMLLAAGKPAASIAAITFTERAAVELRGRVEKFIDLLVDDKIPDDLAPAFRKSSLGQQQLDALASAHGQLGNLSAGTIHAFCLSILQTYAVEAQIDPGAVVIDADQTDVAFDLVIDQWLNERLGDSADPTDPIVVMAAEHPARAVALLHKLAKFRREKPFARPRATASHAGAFANFAAAVDEFTRKSSAPGVPDGVRTDAKYLADLTHFLAPAAGEALSFGTMLSLLHPESPLLEWGDSRLLSPDRFWRDDWVKNDPEQGAVRSAELFDSYEQCGTALGHLMGAMADRLLDRYFDETTSLMDRFKAYKESAAALDFNDILVRAHKLLLENPSVRADVAKRFRHVLVDEFQDTDPLQTQILFLITSTSGSPAGEQLRPGALFLVGDPKQAIYRFRGADLRTYLKTRELVRRQFPANVLSITANFRSETRILKHVDRMFGARLTKQLGDYGELEGTIEDSTGRTRAVVRLPYTVKKPKILSFAREDEARAVASLCASLIGNVRIRRSNGDIVSAEPGDIALLAPTHSELWRYERALEAQGLPVTSQAGKNLYRRQETQDFIALVRALADNRDTLALGAVLRGPLIGLTEHELLAVTEALRESDDAAHIRLSKDASLIPAGPARDVLLILQDLWRRRRGTTPHALLSEAIDRLKAIPSIALRRPDQRRRALANLDMLLERTRSYAVRGLKQLAIDLSAEWEDMVSLTEAPADRAGDSIELVTIHNAKGLEWPIVIPVNLASMSNRTEVFFFNSEHNSLHWTLGDVASSDLEAAVAMARKDIADERERQLYVACTRALDLLIIPDPSNRRKDSWFEFFDLGQASLPSLDRLTQKPRVDQMPGTNDQTSSDFAMEARRIVAASPRLVWHRPSVDDIDREMLDRITLAASEGDDVQGTRDVIIGAGTRRGVVLHKLLEELLIGLIDPSPPVLSARATTLIAAAESDGGPLPIAGEVAQTALETFDHPQLLKYRDDLRAEVSLYAATSNDVLVSARADAIAFKDGQPLAAFDWKSDAKPGASARRHHKAQLAQYLQLIDAPVGAVVYMTARQFHWINQDGSDTGPP